MKRAPTFVLFSAALVVAAACGSSNDSTPAGSAGADASGVCTAGDTRTCVGPGACSGGQVCGSDGTWGTCDCGSGGTSGAGGTAGNAGSGGSAGSAATGGGGTGGSGGNGGSAAGGSAGVAGSAGASGAGGQSGNGGTAGAAQAGAGGSDAGAGAAGIDGGPGPNDSPCPTGLDVDCSGQCHPRDAVCDTAECTTGTNPTTFTLDQRSEFPFTMRLPATPPPLCECQGSSGTLGPGYVIRVKTRIKAVNPFTDPVPGLRILIDGAGWAVWVNGAADTMSCPVTKGVINPPCLVYGDASSNVYVYPYPYNDLSSTPARNVTIELLDNGATGVTCP